MRKFEYTVVIHKAEEGGYWAEVPSLEGCFSQGETIEETLENVKDAIAAHLEALKHFGKAIPKDEDFVISRIAIATT